MTNDFKSSIVSNDKFLPAIHGLRGVAAILVVLYHLSLIAKIHPPKILSFIEHYAGYSVHLFFVLSAFSLMHTTDTSKNSGKWILNYSIKRFFRIAPLFYFFLAIEIIRQASAWKLSISAQDILLNITFTFGLLPFTCIVWGGWSVGVEMIFYAIFPIILIIARTHKSSLIIMILSIAYCYSARYNLQDEFLNSNPKPRWSWSYFSFTSNMCYFFIGIYAYKASEIYKKSLSHIKKTIPIATSALLISLCFFGLGETIANNGRPDIIIWGIGFAGLSIWQSSNPSRILANKALEFLGERSFSIYLSHPVIINRVTPNLLSVHTYAEKYIGSYAFIPCAIILIAIVLAVSEITYRLIETPGIRIGRNIIKRSIKIQTPATPA